MSDSSSKAALVMAASTVTSAAPSVTPVKMTALIAKWQSKVSDLETQIEQESGNLEKIERLCKEQQFYLTRLGALGSVGCQASDSADLGGNFLAKDDVVPSNVRVMAIPANLPMFSLNDGYPIQEWVREFEIDR